MELKILELLLFLKFISYALKMTLTVDKPDFVSDINVSQLWQKNVPYFHLKVLDYFVECT